MVINIAKSEIEELYIVNRMTYLETAKKLNCSVNSIRKAMKQYGIQPRPAGAMKGKPAPEGIGAKISSALKGKSKSAEHRRNLSESKRGVKHPNFGKKSKAHGKRHWHKCPNGETVSMRSGWEIAYAEYLDSQGTNWLYEPKTFILPKGNAYTPDFYLPSSNEYIEVKGWLTSEHKQKMSDFNFTYPQYILTLADKPYLLSLGIDLTKKWKTSKPIRSCAICGKGFHRSEKTQCFCSKSCANKAIIQPGYLVTEKLVKSTRKYNGNQKGCNNNATKITEEQVLTAVRLRYAGSTLKEITKLTSITPGNMSNILRGVSWSKVTGIKGKNEKRSE